MSFHHYTEESEAALRGFALTPRMGKELRTACLSLGKEGKYPRARFKIDASFENGFLENVEAVIPGESQEEVLLTAHLCHPRSSVNDNASGAACAAEVLDDHDAAFGYYRDCAEYMLNNTEFYRQKAMLLT